MAPLRRTDSGEEARLVDVDVAEAGDALLVEQRRLHGPRRRAQHGVEPLLREGVGQRLDAETWQHARFGQRLARPVGDTPEPARIVEAELATVIERCADVRVLRDRCVRITDEEVPGHAEMHHELVAGVETEEQVLAAAFHRAEGLSGEQRREHPAVGVAHDVRAVDGHVLDPPARDRTAKIARDRLHLR